jgi:hypothetical protein
VVVREQPDGEGVSTVAAPGTLSDWAEAEMWPHLGCGIVTSAGKLEAAPVRVPGADLVDERLGDALAPSRPMHTQVHDLHAFAWKVVENISGEAVAVHGSEQGTLAGAICKAGVWEEAEVTAINRCEREYVPELLAISLDLKNRQAHEDTRLFVVAEAGR